MATVNVTVGMTPEMLQEIDEQAEKHGMSRAEWVRHCIRQADDSPFQCPENSLNENASDLDTGAA